MPNKSYSTPKRLAHLQDRYDAVLAKCIKDIEALGFVPSGEIAPHVRITNNKSRMGTCRRSQRLEFHEFGYDVAFVFTISCTAVLADNEDALYDTIYHEVIHTLPNCNGHGAEFKRVMRAVNAAYGTRIATTYNPDTYSDGEVVETKVVTENDVRHLIGSNVSMSYKGQTYTCEFIGFHPRARKFTCDVVETNNYFSARVTPQYIIDNLVGG